MTREENICRPDFFQSGGKNCSVRIFGDPVFLLLQPVDAHDLSLLDQEAEAIAKETDIPFLLAAFSIDDWNSELTPWDAPSVFGNCAFGHGAEETLSYLLQDLIPVIADRYHLHVGGAGRSNVNLPDESDDDAHVEKMFRFPGGIILGGYSLAGLFALWAVTRTGCFQAAAAASPSVWYPGWIDYAASHPVHADAVYLSLGDREEKTRNQVMAEVGTCIRKQYEILSGHVDTVLEWNPGNHFRDSEKRTARAFAWCMENRKEALR